jgi:glycerol-3-phosphate acyltransferase PlsX
LRIGIDLMGSESDPELLLPACIKANKQYGSHHQFHLFCTPPYQEKVPFLVTSCSQVITMEDDPLVAVRTKKDSSLVVGIQALKNGVIDAFVSAANTGALIAASSLFLPPLPGCKRPALLVEIPTVKHPLAIVDVGGRVNPTVEEMLCYALMGADHQRAVRNISLPKVGLLNIGQESKKGTVEAREVFKTLSEGDFPFIFVGNVEARDLFSGEIDVLVTDGFTGNVLVKALEGGASFIFNYLSKELGQDLKPISRHFSYEHHPGARVAGVQGIVIKCHGRATQDSLFSGIAGLL